VITEEEILVYLHSYLKNVAQPCIGQKEYQFIKDLADRNEGKLDQKYAANYRRVLKNRLLQKRKTLTDDLLLINSVLDRLQSLDYLSMVRDDSL